MGAAVAVGVRHVDAAPHNCAVSSQRYPRYRVLTGPDDDAFCYRVSEALDLGYELRGGPAITTRGETAYVAQAVVWTRDEPPPARPAQPR